MAQCLVHGNKDRRRGTFPRAVRSKSRLPPQNFYGFRVADEWYRSPGWSAQDQMDFEIRLKRARAHSRPQYLRVKALALLDSPSPGPHQAGMGLLRRIIEEFPDNRPEVAFAHERLGDEQGRLGQSILAIDEYRRCLATMLPGGSGTTGMVRVKLAELLAAEDSISEAKSEFELGRVDSASARLLFPASEFEFHRVGVKIAQAEEDTESAHAHARAALDAASATRSGAAKHPNLGLVSVDPAILEHLRRIAQLPKRKRGWRGEA